MTKLLTELIGKINPLDINDYLNNGGYSTLKEKITSNKQDLIDEINSSLLTGRGGANYPTGIKIETVANTKNETKYIICNADEGEPGNFKDRYLINNNPHLIIEGMILAAYMTDSKNGYIYIRAEYNEAKKTLEEAIKQAKEHNLLGDNILDTKFSFDIKLFSGAGSYLCGEETALISSIEGIRGKVRVRPPYPATSGLFGKPTLLLNVETFANIPIIFKIGTDKYKTYGTESSTGTRLVSLSGNIQNKGIVEIEMGTSINDILNTYCHDDNIKMIQLGGLSGPIIPKELFDITFDHNELKKEGFNLGSGAIIAIDDTINLFDILINNISFFKHESCGKCTPCREGLDQVLILLNKFKNNDATKKDLDILESLITTINDVSFCPLGQSSVTSIITSLKYYKNDYKVKED